MFYKIQDAKDYPCKGCDKYPCVSKGCVEWQNCFRYHWYKMCGDFGKLKRGERIG